MIEKQRLEQLIEQGAVIWVLYENKIYPHKAKNIVVNGFNSVCMGFDFNDLFETKEDAEEYAEFGNITRTERLELPSWEQVQEGFYYNGSVPIYEDDRNLCFISTSKDIVLKNYASLKNQTKFKKPLTRENYNEARRLCVKLFKGEDIWKKVTNT